MISAINSAEHAEHTSGFIDAIAGRNMMYKADPAPRMKRTLPYCDCDNRICHVCYPPAQHEHPVSKHDPCVWYEWKGGDQPAPDDTVVDVMIRGGATGSGEAKIWDWTHDEGAQWVGDIIYYRVRK